MIRVTNMKLLLLLCFLVAKGTVHTDTTTVDKLCGSGQHNLSCSHCSTIGITVVSSISWTARKGDCTAPDCNKTSVNRLTTIREKCNGQSACNVTFEEDNVTEKCKTQEFKGEEIHYICNNTLCHTTDTTVIIGTETSKTTKPISTTLTTAPEETTSKSKDDGTSTKPEVIVPVVLCILVVLIGIVVGVIILRRRRKKKTAGDKHSLSDYNESDQHIYSVPDDTSLSSSKDVKQNGNAATNHKQQDGNLHVYEEVTETPDDNIPSDGDINDADSWNSESDTYANSQLQKENTLHGNNDKIGSTEPNHSIKPPNAVLANDTVAVDTSTTNVYTKPNKPDKNGKYKTLSDTDMLSNGGMYSLEKEQSEIGDVRQTTNTTTTGDDYSYAYIDPPLQNDGPGSKDSISNRPASIADDNNRASTLSDIAIFTVENDIYSS